MLRLGARREKQEAERLLDSMRLTTLSEVTRWVRKHPDSPDRVQVCEAAMIRYPGDLPKLQKLAAN